jgi:hypothetical protein
MRGSLGWIAALIIALCLPTLAHDLLTLAATPGFSGEVESSVPQAAAVMDFELIDDMRDYEHPEVKDAQNRRIALVSNALRQELDQRALYRVVDHRAAAGLISDFKARQELRNCNGCEIEIGKALAADVIIIGWVQKVSNLILNLNIEVKEVSSRRMLYVKSVDLRGNSDESWLRGIHFMVDSIAEEKQHRR